MDDFKFDANGMVIQNPDIKEEFQFIAFDGDYPKAPQSQIPENIFVPGVRYYGISRGCPKNPNFEN